MFDLPRSYRRQQKALAAGSLAVALLVALAIAFEADLREKTALLALALGLLAFFGGFGLYALRISRRGVHGVEIGRDGIRPLAGGPSRQVSWAELAELRERPVLQRVELRTPGGEVRARLEFQLEGFEDALAAVVANVRPAPHLETRDGRLEVTQPPGQTTLLVIACVAALGFLVWHFDRVEFAVWLALPAVMAGAAFVDRFIVVRSVEVRDGRLLLHAAARRQEIELADVAGTQLRLRELGHGVTRLDLELRLADGTSRFVRPGAADPFALRRLVERGLEDLRRARQRAPGRVR